MTGRHVCFAALLAASACSRSVPPRPNFVVILADDLGYADLAVYGSQRNRTPRLDRMAAEGLRFTDFHSNGPMCSATRAALLTGLYPQRFGLRFEGALSGTADYDSGLPLEATTVAEALAAEGYATGMYGKWHLGYSPPFMPTEQGFGDFRGLASGDGDHHSRVDRSGREDWWHNTDLRKEEGYTGDLITAHSVDFIERHRERPFFVYVAHLAIHFPWQGPDDRGYRVKGGNYHNLTKLGELDGFEVASQVNRMIESLDGSVGRILDAVDENGLAERTLVFFASDNGGYLTYQGGYHNISENGPLRGQKTDVYEGGHRVPAIARWPGRVRPGVTDALAATFDLFPTMLELAGAARAAPATDGASLAPVLFGRGEFADRTLFWRIRGETAVRRGLWKLVRQPSSSPELYDLSRDLGESDNLAATSPDVAAELGGALAAWERDVDSGRD